MGGNTDIATRAVVVALKSPFLKDIPDAGFSDKEVARITGLGIRTSNYIYARAVKNGFNPSADHLIIKDEFLRDAPKSGRPKIQSEETTEAVIAKVSKDRDGREKSCCDIATELSKEGRTISQTTVWRVLNAAGYNKTKPTKKPGLSKEMRKKRLAWCIDHAHWTLEDWKRVIWSDETAVVLCRRGGYRVWRKPSEAVTKSCIRERWKGFSQFMFWGCFSYDFKGPCHIWAAETAEQKKLAQKEVDKMNEEFEPYLREKWELETGMKRLGLRTKPGRKPQWKLTVANGKLTRSGKGGIDWYRYRKEIILDKMIPFAKECEKTTTRGMLVQEDNAPAHAHWIQAKTYDLHKVQKLLWCPNSPDLNAIEPCWMWMKRVTTRKGTPQSKVQAVRVWKACWRILKQQRIREWIERIPIHIKKIIELEGGNEYIEGRDAHKPRTKRRPIEILTPDDLLDGDVDKDEDEWEVYMEDENDWEIDVD